MFKLNRKNGVSYYTITSFEETGLVKHGFSTREGGVSDGPAWQDLKPPRPLSPPP